MAAEDLDRLMFRKRVAAARGSNATSPSQLTWIVLALVGVFVFVWLVRALLDRTSDTGGSSTEAATASGQFVPDGTPAASAQFPEQEPAASVSIPEEPVPMVYRCVGKGGSVSLQSQPCSADQRVTRAIYAPPEAEPPRRAAVISPASTQAIGYGSGPSAADYELARRRAACANAKSSRDATLASVGLARTYDLLQQLDAMVYEACKGQ